MYNKQMEKEKKKEDEDLVDPGILRVYFSPFTWEGCGTAVIHIT